MAKKLSVGDVVQYRFFNTPDRKFYGPVYTGTIIDIVPGTDKPYVVEDAESNLHQLRRKEIKQRLS